MFVLNNSKFSLAAGNQLSFNNFVFNILGELCDKAINTKPKCGECFNGKCQISSTSNKYYCQCDTGKF